MSTNKFDDASKATGISNLPSETVVFLRAKSEYYRFSFQEIKFLVELSLKFQMWDVGTIETSWPTGKDLEAPNSRKKIILILKQALHELESKPKSYESFTPEKHKYAVTHASTSSDHNILGECPVASEKTRCCNLKTLDTVRNCGYGCTYCSIQSFYYDNKVYFDDKLSEKLDALVLDPDKTYHIGTGQSSDSLMWGNKDGLLDHLFAFASKNQNIILELKTKSDNIDYLLQNDIPKNIITTWSLNPDTIVNNEEHFTASLDQRLAAAKKIHDKGNLVGFHFHPMVYYKNYADDYKAIAERIERDFNPKLVTHISIGTLTFIKPVIKELFKRAQKSKILQMELVDIAGKLSYPYEIKKEMFTNLYRSFSSQFISEVYFYMCMEDLNLWRDVFGSEYTDNEAFEKDMINSYMTKIKTNDII